MSWAARVAELRLWLHLLIDAEFSAYERTSGKPLLPNLSFNVRVGDSIVQEAGGVSIDLPDLHHLSADAARKLERLRRAKTAYYKGGDATEGWTRESIENLERQTYIAILQARLDAKRNQLTECTTALAPKTNLFGETRNEQLGLDRPALERRRKRLQREIPPLEGALSALRVWEDDPFRQSHPFAWRLAFAEHVTRGEQGMFDIVIGNPPYLRQEHIHDPTRSLAECSRADKTAYKSKLKDAVYRAWSVTFGAGQANGGWKLAGRSDYYIYFYLYGLSLLKTSGIFCFITSNAWLDVDYGKDLQRFLLTRGLVKLVVDNESHRSFERADVNTVIVLLGRPVDGQGERRESLDHMARFAMVRVPYEETLDAIVWEEICDAVCRMSRVEFRVHPLTQRDALAAGIRSKGGGYAGDKWGGKYLRAPDIYWHILEKAGDKLVRLGDIADVRRGFTTGANDFFYLDDARIAEWGIEDEFLRPVVKSPRECYSVQIPDNQVTCVFSCSQPTERLRGTAAMEYILWGESLALHRRRTCATRKRWYDLNVTEAPQAAWPRTFFERHICFELAPDTHCSDRFYGLYGDGVSETLLGFLNSTLVSLMVEVNGYQVNHGGIDTSVWWVESIPVPRYRDEGLERAYAVIRQRKIELCNAEIRMADRRNLDVAALHLIGLDSQELPTLYTKVGAMVRERIHKSGRELTGQRQCAR